MQPLVSVVMPTYNQGNFIRESISSVLGQDYKDIELIIIDNYSCDNTETVVRSFDDGRIRYFRLRNNGVIAVSRNVGIEKAKGAYIAFIDSDDMWYPSKISAQMEFLEMYPEIALVACDLDIYQENVFINRTLLHGMKKEVRGSIFDKIIFKNAVSCSSVLVRSEVFKNIGVFDEDPRLVSIEDWDLWLRITHSYPACIIPEVLGRYTLHRDNISKKSSMLNKMTYVIDKSAKNAWISERRAGLLKLLIYMRRIIRRG